MSSNDGVAPAKITCPRSVRVYERDRLFERLDAERRRRRIVWIAAPAGAGKTTLVASYLHARDVAAVWYGFDSGDGDVASFFSYLARAARQAAPRKTGVLPLFTAEYLAGLRTFARNYFRRFFEHIHPTPVVVFDDYHAVADGSLLHEAMREGLAEVPENVTVIVLSRGEPPAQLARLRTLDTFALLGWRELQLSVEESVAIGAMRSEDEAPSEARLQRLHELAQGWVAGLILMLEQRQDTHLRDVSAPAQDNTPSPLVFDYFAGEVFPGLDATIQSFLVKVALLPSMSVAAAASLSGTPEAGDLLSDLFRRNFFTARHQRGRTFVYEFHNLFRQYLLTQGREMLPAEELVALKRRAAALLVEEGQSEQAVALLQEVGDWEGLIPLVLQQALPLVRQGRIGTLSEWLGAIPEALRGASPWLSYFLGVCHLATDLPQARRFFETSYEGFKAQPDPQGLFLAWTGIAESYLYEWNSFVPVDRWIEAFDWMRSRYPEFPGRDVEVRAVAAIFALLIYRQPQHPDVVRWAERLEDLLRSSTDPVERMTVGNHLLLYHAWWTANGPKTDEIAAWLAPPPGRKEDVPLLAIVREASVAASCWMKGDHQGCRAAVRKGLQLAEESGVHMWDFMLLAQDVWASITAGDLDEAQRGLAALRTKVHPARRMDLGHYYFLAHVEARERGDTAQMSEYAAQVMRLTQEGGSTWFDSISLSAQALSDFLRGDVATAERHLERCKRLVEGTVINPHFVLFTEARFAFAQGDEARGLAALRELFANDRASRVANAATWNNATMAELCAKALEHDIEPEHVKWIIRQRGIAPPRSMPHVASWPWPIRIRTLGTFAVERDDSPVLFGGTGGRKPVALLAALIAFGGRSVNQDDLAEALWPDADGDAGRASFNTTLHRLRKLLGAEALVLKDGLLSLSTRHCWVDCHAFEQTIDTGADRALALYRGPFLPTFQNEPWAITARERLRSKFLRQIARLAQRQERANDWPGVIETYRRALEVEPFGEEAYRGLMRAHLAQGDHGEALATYARCREVLASTLGVEPSRETEALLRGLSPRKS